MRPLLVAQSAFAFLAALLSFSGPFFLNRIIRFVQEYSATSNMPEPVTGTNWGSPFLLVIGLFVSSVVRASADGQTYFLGRRMGTRIRAAVIGELYAKSLRRLLHSSSASDPAGAATPPSRGAHSGEIINLMSVGRALLLSWVTERTYSNTIAQTPTRSLKFRAILCMSGLCPYKSSFP